LPLTPDAESRRRRDVELERLKERLLREHLCRADHPAVRNQLRRAAREAAALAWTTPYALLVFPGLLEEKLSAARRYVERQAQLRAAAERQGPAAQLRAA
jgi:hypothetical protein